MAEEEVGNEVEAVLAIYGDDCRVIQCFPPNLHVHLKPRTADDLSQQFVEVVLGLCADPQYPKEPPHIDIIDSKGLDEKRKAHLLTSIKEKASELLSYPMLVALCEEAVELLSNINHPDGNCPLCLYPLAKEDVEGDFLPFMKLMSCFHCFHSKCIIRWWNWLQEQHGNDPSLNEDLPGTMKENWGSCPVCREVFHAKDIEHVVALIETSTSQLSLEESESEDDEKILQSEAENIRKHKLEVLSKLQNDRNGLIETKRHEVLLPGVFLPEPIRAPAESIKASSEQQQAEPTDASTSETAPSRFLHEPSTIECRNSGMRKDRLRNKSKHKTKWIKREKTME